MVKKSEANVTRTDKATKTVLVITVGFALVYLATGKTWTLYVSIAVGLMGAVSDYFSRKLDFLWMGLARLLGLIVPNIILGLVFYLFLFPLSLFARLFRREDPLRLQNRGDTVFIKVDKTFDKNSFEKPW